MTQLKSGVYFVRYQDITKFFQDAEKNGWKHDFDEPQVEIYATLNKHDQEKKTIKQLVIPFSLDKRKRRIGWWSQDVYFESDVEETMGNWNDWDWSEKHIEVYQSKKVVR